MRSIQIRLAEANDVDDIIRIYTSIVRRDVDVSFKKSIEKRAIDGREDTICYVADDGEKVVGFMIGHILIPGFGMEKSAWIAVVGVDPGCMGRDIGTLLADKIFEFFRSIGVNRVHTSVLWDSTDVLSFFKAIGFNRSQFVELQKNLD